MIEASTPQRRISTAPLPDDWIATAMKHGEDDDAMLLQVENKRCTENVSSRCGEYHCAELQIAADFAQQATG